MDLILCILYFTFLVIAILYAWVGGIATNCMNECPAYVTKNPDDKLYTQNTLPIAVCVIVMLLLCGSIQVYLSTKK
jgi:hypothetical protein